ncbi:MAG: type II secretion system protein [Patescibacteria group bacterium]
MSKKGFTLIELLIIMIILGVIAAMISGNFMTSLKKGRDAKRKADLESMQKAMELYYEDQRRYPPSINAGSPLNDSVSGKVYMQSIPYDPKGTRYEYETDATGSYYRLFACLENNLQILPYTANGATFPITCSVQCMDLSDTASDCVWVVSSTNVPPIP